MRIPLAFSESSNCGKRGHGKKMREAKQGRARNPKEKTRNRKQIKK